MSLNLLFFTAKNWKFTNFFYHSFKQFLGYFITIFKSRWLDIIIHLSRHFLFLVPTKVKINIYALHFFGLSECYVNWLIIFLFTTFKLCNTVYRIIHLGHNFTLYLFNITFLYLNIIFVGVTLYKYIKLC